MSYSLNRLLRPLVAGCLVVVSACSQFSVDLLPGNNGESAKQATLADLKPAIIPQAIEPLPQVSLDTLIDTYRSVLTVTNDPVLKLRVQQRLAGLEMKRGEEALYQQDQGAASHPFNLAIDAYLALLSQNPDSADNDHLLYQLSKAYDLGGQTERSMAVLTQLISDFPESRHYVEAQFRRAEIFFAEPDYRQAEIAYGDVVKAGNSSRYYQNALYMYGWSLFKQQRYRAAIKPFSTVLDLNVPANNQLQSLDRGQRELTQDVFKILSIVFSYLDGPVTIEEVYSTLGEKHYLPLLYDNLAQLYLKQQRYRDSGESYRHFVDKYPRSDDSPIFYARLIDAYVAGGFPEDVLREKARYIDEYGIYSEFWQQKPDSSREYIRPFLASYLPELARHYHARAQLARTALEKPADQRLKASQRQQLEQETLVQFIKAGDYYQQFIDTFPDDRQVPENHFLLAESRFEAGLYQKAIEAYEVVAYKYADQQRGAVAGYAAIVAYGELLSRLPPSEATAKTTTTEYQHWQRLKIASQLRFASIYHTDPRASAVQVKSAEELLALQSYQQAIEAASQLTRQQPAAPAALLKTAWLVIGHSEFELQRYANAEQAYSQTLQWLPADDNGRPAITDRLAASIYKQAEQTLADGAAERAAEQFLRVASVAPASAISITAQYDAANALLNDARYERAIDILAQFRAQYPNNPLSADIPAKLVVAYQQSGQWAKAAAELTAIYQQSDDKAIQQESLYQAAQLFEKAGDRDTAILRYRSYANRFEEPFGIAMEARFKLSQLYRETQQTYKERFWLKKMIAADKAAGQQRTERSRYLAAYSSSVLADDEFKAFSQIRLTLPLKNSLKKKKKALNKSLDAYQRLSDYGIERFSTLATFRIAAVYDQLSQDLMNSQRPENLDALALEQYELLLEEQAYPFEEKAIDLHEANVQRSWAGVYDRWVKESFSALKVLLPARYGKQEKGVLFANEIY